MELKNKRVLVVGWRGRVLLPHCFVPRTVRS